MTTSLPEGQLGTGALSGPDELLLPPDTLAAVLAHLAAGGEIEALLGPAQAPSGDDVLERRSIVRVLPVGVAQYESASLLGLAVLDSPSAYRPVPDVLMAPERTAQIVAFSRTLEAENDLWAALVASGLLPEGFDVPPDARWLDAAQGVLSDRRSIVVPTTYEQLGPDFLCGWFCYWCPRCK